MTEPPQRRRPGGRVAGRSYAPAAPKTYGAGKFPYVDYSDVEWKPLRDTLVQWQDICLDVREKRIALGWNHGDVAALARVSPSTVERLESGEWVAAHVLFQVVSVLDLQVWQTVEVRRNSPPPERRRRAR